MKIEEFQNLALSFNGTEANPHFDRIAYKVVGKRIFATLFEANQTANIKLNLIDQSVFCSFDQQLIYAVPNKWGLQGWTTFEIERLRKELLLDALECAYKQVFKP